MTKIRTEFQGPRQHHKCEGQTGQNLLQTAQNKIKTKSGAPNGNFRENICSEDDLRTRIFETFVVKFLASLPLLGFSNTYKMV